jgi:CheY-like chemotaxis protein
MAKVLLVEDDNNLREIFQMRLQAESYETLAAGDGEEALGLAVKEKPDLIIADVMMPKLSGFEMLETLRSSPEMKNTKVIMMTALGQAEDRARGEKLGVIKYLVKSQVTLEDFVRVVREVMQPDQAGAAGTAAPATNPVNADSLATNNQESEKTMPEDNQTPSNPMPDSSAPANPVSGDSGSSSMPGTSGQMGMDEEKKEVQDQMATSPLGGSSTPSAPAGDTPDMSGNSGSSDAGTTSPTTPPVEPTSPPADPAGGTPPSMPGGV